MTQARTLDELKELMAKGSSNPLGQMTAKEYAVWSAYCDSQTPIM